MFGRARLADAEEDRGRQPNRSANNAGPAARSRHADDQGRPKINRAVCRAPGRALSSPGRRELSQCAAPRTVLRRRERFGQRAAGGDQDQPWEFCLVSETDGRLAQRGAARQAVARAGDLPAGCPERESCSAAGCGRGGAPRDAAGRRRRDGVEPAQVPNSNGARWRGLAKRVRGAGGEQPGTSVAGRRGLHAPKVSGVLAGVQAAICLSPPALSLLRQAVRLASGCRPTRAVLLPALRLARSPDHAACSATLFLLLAAQAWPPTPPASLRPLTTLPPAQPSRCHLAQSSALATCLGRLHAPHWPARRRPRSLRTSHRRPAHRRHSALPRRRCERCHSDQATASKRRTRSSPALRAARQAPSSFRLGSATLQHR